MSLAILELMRPFSTIFTSSARASGFMAQSVSFSFLALSSRFMGPIIKLATLRGFAAFAAVSKKSAMGRLSTSMAASSSGSFVISMKRFMRCEGSSGSSACQAASCSSEMTTGSWSGSGKYR